MPVVFGSPHVAKVHQYAALLNGTRASPLHGDCKNPVGIEYRAGQDEALHRLKRWREDETLDIAPGYGLFGDWLPSFRTSASLTVRCRKCGPCLKQRAKVWATRGQIELVASRRSWFGTLTLSPESRFIARLKADAAVSNSARWSDLDDTEQFKEIAKVIRREFQLFLKRVRKQSGARFRYLCTTEAHKDGFPHVHLLLHEVSETRVTKRLLEKQWQLGISHWRLVNNHDHKVPWYVAKYLTKSILAKPVASLRYGRPPVEALTETIGDAVLGRSPAPETNPPSWLKSGAVHA